MGHRQVGVVAVVLAILTGVTARPAGAEPVGEASLEVSAPAAVQWGRVSVTGSCPGKTVTSEPTGSETPAGATEYPSTTVLSLVGTQYATRVPLTDGRFRQPVDVQIPLTVPPGEYDMVTTCGGSAPFTVLDAELLNVAPDRVEAGETVVVTGTCRLYGVVGLTPAGIDLAGNGRWILGPLVLDTSTGVIAASRVTVPADVPPGKYQGTSNCDTTVNLEVLPATSGTTPPSPTPSGGEEDLVAVPTLLGLTREDAEAALGDQLRLGDVVGTGGEIVRQDPLPGERVQRGTAVTVELELAASDEAETRQDDASFPVGVILAAVLVGLPVAFLGARAASPDVRRRRHEGRWVRTEVDTEVTRGGWDLPDGPEAHLPVVDVRLKVVRTPPQLEFQEVHHGPD
jgi:hypothetical protein